MRQKHREKLPKLESSRTQVVRIPPKASGFVGVKVGGTYFMAKITIKELESLTAEDAGRILREEGNLAGRISVRKNGVSVSFFYRYRWGDQNKEHVCETWPRKFLTDIRKARNQARALIDEQINPNEHKKTANAQAYAAANVEAEQIKTAVQRAQQVICQFRKPEPQNCTSPCSRYASIFACRPPTAGEWVGSQAW